MTSSAGGKQAVAEARSGRTWALYEWLALPTRPNAAQLASLEQRSKAADANRLVELAARLVQIFARSLEQLEATLSRGPLIDEASWTGSWELELRFHSLTWPKKSPKSSGRKPNRKVSPPKLGSRKRQPLAAA